MESFATFSLIIAIVVAVRASNRYVASVAAQTFAVQRFDLFGLCFMYKFFSFILILWISLPGVSYASDADQAEHVRLSSEMRRLAQRNIWTGVERAYQESEALQTPLSFTDHVVGAHAAHARGDLATARERLMAAHRLKEDPMVLDWLWTIDTRFAQVELHTVPGKTLEFSVPVFQPDLNRVLEHAATSLQSSGSYAGLLPIGQYSLGGKTFEVTAGDYASRLDLRTHLD